MNKVPVKNMNVKRTEIMPGVFLNYLRSNKFKTSLLSISLLTQLSRDTASMNALIPSVLRRGTSLYPDMEKLSSRMDELYGTVIEPIVRRTGEIQSVGFAASFPESAFLPGKENILKDVCTLVSELLLSPVTRGGLFLPSYVESEKEKLIELIDSLVNEKRAYALTRCLQEMCCYESIAVGRLGSSDDCRNINYKKLTKHYHELLQTSPIEIYYFGQESEKDVAACLKDSLCTLPRKEINYDIGTEIRMNALEDHTRYYEEKLDVTQGKLVIGFRLGEIMEDFDLPAFYVFNAVYGSGVTSKLFTNVREKLSLCYYASSIVDWHKGLMFVTSGIDFDKFDAAKSEIMAQLEEVKNGNITDDELAYAKASIASDLHALSDSQPDMENFYFSSTVEGLDMTPDELSDLVQEVTKDQIVSVANSIDCDLVYFLKGLDKNENENE